MVTTGESVQWYSSDHAKVVHSYDRVATCAAAPLFGTAAAQVNTHHVGPDTGVNRENCVLWSA
ncbi:MAG: hypothetical protein ABWZ98_09475 [Nakamurella sp.]